LAWLIVGVVLLIFNTLVGAGRLAERLPDASNRLSFAFGQAFALSLIVGVVALLSPANRNPRSLGKVLFWTQVIAIFVVVSS